MSQAKSEVLAIIPGKGASSRIPGKNLRALGNKPLIAWTIEAALGAKSVSRTVVSTEDHRVAAVAMAWGAEVVSHPPLDSLPEVPDVCLHVLEELDAQGYRPDVVVCLLPTSPFRTAEHIDAALGLMGRYDVVLSVSQARHHRGLRVHGSTWPMQASRDAEHNGAILIACPFGLAQDGFFNPNGAIAYPMLPPAGLDINTEQDFKYAERIAARVAVPA